jgi:hypothetical protein
MESFSYLDVLKSDRLLIMIMIEREYIVNNVQSRCIKADISDTSMGPLGKVLETAHSICLEILSILNMIEQEISMIFRTDTLSDALNWSRS